MQAVEDHILGILFRDDECATLGDKAGACQRRRSPVSFRDDRRECCDVARINFAPARVLRQADLMQLDDLGANLLRHLGTFLRRRCICLVHCADEPAQKRPARKGVVPNVRHKLGRWQGKLRTSKKKERTCLVHLRIRRLSQAGPGWGHARAHARCFNDEVLKPVFYRSSVFPVIPVLVKL